MAVGVESLGAIPSPATGVDTRPATIPYVRESVDGREMALLSGSVGGGAWARGLTSGREMALTVADAGKDVAYGHTSSGDGQTSDEAAGGATGTVGSLWEMGGMGIEPISPLKGGLPIPDTSGTAGITLDTGITDTGTDTGITDTGTDTNADTDTGPEGGVGGIADEGRGEEREGGRTDKGGTPKLKGWVPSGTVTSLKGGCGNDDPVGLTSPPGVGGGMH